MSRIMRGLLWSGLAMLSLTLFTPAESAAAGRDRYWEKYWGWYDNDYRPYYYNYGRRHYAYRQPYYNYNYNYRQPDFDGQRYFDRDGYVDPRNYRQFQRNPQYHRGGGRVDVGPLQFWW